MNRSDIANPWAEINGGLRGSALLTMGAILTILATWQNFAAIFLAAKEEPLSGTLVAAAWLCWILALLLLATGFLWVGLQPFLSRLGLLVGVFHLINSIILFATLFLGMVFPVPAVALSIGRTLLLFFFAISEKKYLKPFVVRALATVAMLQFLKISLRLMDVVPPFNQITNAGLDSLLLTLLAACIIMMAQNIKKVENSWAIELASTRASGFAEFNNPEHDWNQD